MFANSKAFLLAAVTAVVTPAFAHAATVSLVANQNYTFAEVISPDETLEFRFEVSEDLMIANYSVSGTGTNTGVDLETITFGFSQPTSDGFDVIQVQGNAAAGIGFLEGRTWRAGDMFSIFVEDGIRNDVGITLSFATESIAPIPLPATALMLAPVLLGGGLVAMRRRKTA